MFCKALNMLLILSMSGFCIYHSFKYVRVTQGSYIYFIVIPHLKEPYNHFFESITLIFSIVAGSIWFCFRPNTFISKISNLQLHLGAERPRCCESYPTSKIPDEYILDDFFNDLFMYFVVVVFSLFGTSRIKSKIHKRCNCAIL